MCDMTHPEEGIVARDRSVSFVCRPLRFVTCLIHMCDMTIRMCGMAYSGKGIVARDRYVSPVKRGRWLRKVGSLKL